MVRDRLREGWQGLVKAKLDVAGQGGPKLNGLQSTRQSWMGGDQLGNGQKHSSPDNNTESSKVSPA